MLIELPSSIEKAAVFGKQNQHLFDFYEEGRKMSSRNAPSASSSIVISLSSPDHIHLGVKKPESIRLLCFDLTSRSRVCQLLACSSAIFVFFVIYGYVQEKIFHLPGYSELGWFLTCVQFGFYTIFAYCERRFTGESLVRRISIKKYLQLAFYTVATIGLSNASLGYLNYPAQVIFKCCKLIPVLIGGIIIQGKRYNLLDFVAAGCMSLGLILFTLVDSSISPNFHVKGYLMVCLALVADACIGNVQEKEFKQHSASNNEMIFYSYSIGFVYILIGILLTGELFTAISLYNEHTSTFYVCTIIFSIVGYLGVNVIITLVKNFSAFVAVTVTTCRKAVTIILSFILFSKPFSVQYVWSGLIVLLGIYLSAHSKDKTLVLWISKLGHKLKLLLTGVLRSRPSRSPKSDIYQLSV